MTPAVIIPWRAGETELQSTIDSAAASIGAGATIIPVEDKAGDGPAMMRHRGIEAAGAADVIVIVDAHMMFQGHVLRDMARDVALMGDLLCAKCHHNSACAFNGMVNDGGKKGMVDCSHYYAGADIEYTGEDQNGRQALIWKWSADKTPGPRACIGGACYVFRREWYYETGQCLSALPAWGCDEEALSITAWLSGAQPRVFDGRVAHRYRAKAPWSRAARPIKMSRAALISAVVADAGDRAALLKYQGVQPLDTVEVVRWRAALLKQSRTWAQWKAEVPIMAKNAKAIESAKSAVKRTTARANYGATENLRTCPACGSEKSVVTNTRHVGRLTFRYRVCDCGRRRVTRQGE